MAGVCLTFLRTGGCQLGAACQFQHPAGLRESYAAGRRSAQTAAAGAVGAALAGLPAAAGTGVQAAAAASMQAWQANHQLGQQPWAQHTQPVVLTGPKAGVWPPLPPLPFAGAPVQSQGLPSSWKPQQPQQQQQQRQQQEQEQQQVARAAPPTTPDLQCAPISLGTRWPSQMQGAGQGWGAQQHGQDPVSGGNRPAGGDGGGGRGGGGGARRRPSSVNLSRHWMASKEVGRRDCDSAHNLACCTSLAHARHPHITMCGCLEGISVCTPRHAARRGGACMQAVPHSPDTAAAASAWPVLSQAPAADGGAGGGVRLRVMSYNLLADALVGRAGRPHGGLLSAGGSFHAPGASLQGAREDLGAESRVHPMRQPDAAKGIRSAQ
jgi:hypothetical protein